MKIYIATRLENHEQARALASALEAVGHEITYPWWIHGAVWREGPSIIRHVALSEARGVRAADVVIGMLPGGRGTHFELGMAYGALVERVNVALNSSEVSERSRPGPYIIPG